MTVTAFIVALVGTREGLRRLTIGADQRVSHNEDLGGGWITVVLPRHSGAVLAASYDGQLYHVADQLEPYGSVGFSPWVLSEDAAGSLVVGGSRGSLAYGDPPLRADSVLSIRGLGPLASHSGGQPHVLAHAACAGHVEFIGVEIGGVATRERFGRWQAINSGLDPDVHSLITGFRGGHLLAGTGTGVFRFDPTTGSWGLFGSQPLRYTQALVRTSEGFLASAGERPFGRPTDGPYAGTSRHNEFGVLDGDRRGRWTSAPADLPWSAGILRRGLFADPTMPGFAAAGDLAGVVRVRFPGSKVFHTVQTGFPAIESVALLSAAGP